MTPLRKTVSLVAALAISLPGRPTELDTQKEASPYGNGKPHGLVYLLRLQTNNDVCPQTLLNKWTISSPMIQMLSQCSPLGHCVYLVIQLSYLPPKLLDHKKQENRD
jgi:hypothetical protein